MYKHLSYVCTNCRGETIWVNGVLCIVFQCIAICDWILVKTFIGNIHTYNMYMYVCVLQGVVHCMQHVNNGNRAHTYICIQYKI